MTTRLAFLIIDRSRLFNPAEFIRSGWTIWKGPPQGNGLEGEEDQDERSLALTEIDLSKVQLERMLQKGEDSVKGETKLARLKVARHVRLDAKVCQTIWANKHLIPESWKEKSY